MTNRVQYLAVDFEPDITSSSSLINASNCKHLDYQRLALLNGDVHLFANGWLAQKVSSRKNAERKERITK